MNNNINIKKDFIMNLKFKKVIIIQVIKEVKIIENEFENNKFN